MTPQTTRAEDAFHREKDTQPAPTVAWICFLCRPNVTGFGGSDGFYSHYNVLHLGKPLPEQSAETINADVSKVA